MNALLTAFLNTFVSHVPVALQRGVEGPQPRLVRLQVHVGVGAAVVVAVRELVLKAQAVTRQSDPRHGLVVEVVAADVRRAVAVVVDGVAVEHRAWTLDGLFASVARSECPVVVVLGSHEGLVGRKAHVASSFSRCWPSVRSHSSVWQAPLLQGAVRQQRALTALHQRLHCLVVEDGEDVSRAGSTPTATFALPRAGWPGVPNARPVARPMDTISAYPYHRHLCPADASPRQHYERPTSRHTTQPKERMRLVWVPKNQE
ncbi:hypothetical protein CRUP_007595 [Coryphaenoides rupestris]|nr:hypothetical protein CRUP_007595 [Coryphaenoides rupestris]